MHTLSVDLGSRSYPIHIGAALLQDPGKLKEMLQGCIRGRQVALFTNHTVGELYASQVHNALADYHVDTFVMEDGEQYKSLQTYGQAMDFLMQHRHNRTTCLLALGGGVVGDLTGFVAATFQRGVDFVQIPTTLLAQVDSSVGGKTAVNHPGGKNMIGAFYQPRAVVIDTQVLQTLPDREYAAGLAEVVKYGVIADKKFFTYLEDHVDELNGRDMDALAHVIQRSCEIKADVVAQDETEAGVRAVLNFGHTFGHAIENLSGYGAWLHGEAVAVGMVMAARFSQALNLLGESQATRIVQLLAALKLPTTLTNNVGAQDMLTAMGMDKKAADGRLRFVVASALGQVQVTDSYNPQALNDVLAEFC